MTTKQLMESLRATMAARVQAFGPADSFVKHVREMLSAIEALLTENAKLRAKLKRQPKK